MELSELYQELIIDHGTSPRNHRKLENYTHKAEGFNTLCGDKLDLFLIVKDDIISELAFIGNGCAISMASTSIMTEILKGKTIDEAKKIFKNFHELVTTDKELDDSFGKLAALAGVRAYPARVKCATLAWHTLDSALKEKTETTTTEI